MLQAAEALPQFRASAPGPRCVVKCEHTVSSAFLTRHMAPAHRNSQTANSELDVQHVTARGSGRKPPLTQLGRKFRNTNGWKPVQVQGAAGWRGLPNCLVQRTEDAAVSQSVTSPKQRSWVLQGPIDRARADLVFLNITLPLFLFHSTGPLDHALTRPSP